MAGIDDTLPRRPPSPHPAGTGRRPSRVGIRVTSWDEALDRVVSRLGELRARHGADAVGVFGGGGLLGLEAARGLGDLG